MLDKTFGAAALAGLLSFLSPRILPMVPFCLCSMAGLSMTELRADGARFMGRACGFGWTARVGPALAAILMVAGGMGDPARGGALPPVHGSVRAIERGRTMPRAGVLRRLAHSWIRTV